MEHVVFYPALDGAPAFRRFASLDDAVRFVEHLKNAEGVSEVSVHTLSPVPLAFRAYYKVEVPAEAAPVAEVPMQAEPAFDVPVPAVAESAPEPVAESAPEPTPELEPVAVMAETVVPAPPASNGKKSLGFFAH